MRAVGSHLNRAASDTVSGDALTLFCAMALKKAVEEQILPVFTRVTGTAVDVVFEPT